MTRFAPAALVGLLALAAACAHEGNVHFDPTLLHAEGGVRYSTELLPGEHGPTNRDKSPAVPKVTPDFKGPPPTNDWSSSLLWAFDGNPYSRPMFPHPLAVQAVTDGLGVSYPSTPTIAPREYRYPYAEDLRISTTGLKAPDARMQASTEWTVTASWTDGSKHLDATFGHGIPFVYVHSSGDARITIGADAQTFASHGEVMGVTIHGHDYGLFAPTGSTWKADGTAVVSDLSGKGFCSVAALPDHTPETLELYRRHAYAFVTDTRVTWKFDPHAAKIVSHFEAATALAEPGADRVNETIVALYPHQWKATHTPLSKLTYASPRGLMKVVASGNSFDVERGFHGVLPTLPAVDEGRSQVAGYLHDEASAGELFPAGLDGKKDTYWAGKSLGRVSTLAWIAHGLGDDKTVKRLVGSLTRELDDWFDGTPPERFYYDTKWATLIGMPAGYQSDTELNDHHFHYGYFVWAAATVAALDPTGAARDRWAPFIRLLIKDVANTDDGDHRFPRLRSLDPYAGHAWASGASMFDHGNNEESSSEDANCAAALVLWGNVTGDTATRDLGIFWYETLVSAVEQYWLDVDHDVFPKGFDHAVAGIVWGDGAVYDTWWDRNPVYIHGINMLPMTGASLYLGRHPEAVHTDEQALLAKTGGAVRQWRDVLWMDFALDDAKSASALVDHDHYFDTEFGNSWAATLSWVRALDTLGRVDSTVLSDATSYAVFRKKDVRSYTAYNPTASPLHVTFTDGATLDVPPGAMRTSTGAAPVTAH